MLSTAAAIMAAASMGNLAAAAPNHGSGGMSHGPSMGSSGPANRGGGTTGYGGPSSGASNHAMVQGQGAGRMVGNGRTLGNRNFANRNFANGNVANRSFNGRNDRFAHDRGRDRRGNRFGAGVLGFGYGYSYDDSWDDGDYAYQDCSYANDWRARQWCGPYASSAYGPTVYGW